MWMAAERKNEGIVGNQRKTRKCEVPHRRARDIVRPRKTTRGSSEPCFAKPAATLLPHTPFQHTQGPTDPRLYNNTPTDPRNPAALVHRNASEAYRGRAIPTAWSAARSSSARPRPGPRRGKCTEPSPWGLEASRRPLRKPKGLPP